MSLESMNRLFSEAPLFVAGKDLSRYKVDDLDERARAIAEEKGLDDVYVAAGKH